MATSGVKMGSIIGVVGLLQRPRDIITRFINKVTVAIRTYIIQVYGTENLTH